MKKQESMKKISVEKVRDAEMMSRVQSVRRSQKKSYSIKPEGGGYVKSEIGDDGWRCVSRKFYTDIDRRLRESVRFTGGSDEDYAAIKASVDQYLADGSVPADDSDVKLRLVFSILRPEIDKAVARSRKARERAKSRKTKAVMKSETGCGEVRPDDARPVDLGVSTGGIDDKTGSIPTDSEIERVMTMAMREVAEDETLSYKLTRRQRRRLEQERKRITGKRKNVPLGNG